MNLKIAKLKIENYHKDMPQNISRELLICAGIILLLIAAITTSHITLNEYFLAAAVGAIITLGVFGILIYGADPENTDWRDRRTGDRAAFISAVGVLLAGILAEAITQQVDIWLLVALAAALIAKLIGMRRRR